MKCTICEREYDTLSKVNFLPRAGRDKKNYKTMTFNVCDECYDYLILKALYPGCKSEPFRYLKDMDYNIYPTFREDNAEPCGCCGKLSIVHNVIKISGNDFQLGLCDKCKDKLDNYKKEKTKK